MNERKFTDSICSLSWINKRTGLPEHDRDGPPSIIHGHQITREDDALPFRFLNLLEATILVDRSSPSRVVSSIGAQRARFIKILLLQKSKARRFQLSSPSFPPLIEWFSGRQQEHGRSLRK